MRWATIIATGLVLGAAVPALAQGNPSSGPGGDGPPQNFSEPRFDPRYGPPPGRPPMSEGPFTPRRDFRPPPPGFDPRDEPDRNARRTQEPLRVAPRPDPRDTARRAPLPPPKSHVERRPPPRETARHAAPPRRDARRAPSPRDDRYARRDERYEPPSRKPMPPDYREGRRDEPRYDLGPPPRDYGRRDERDRGPPPRDVARRSERDRGPPPRGYGGHPPDRALDRREPRDHRESYRDDPRDRRGPPPRDYRDDRREPRYVPPRDHRDARRDEPRQGRGNPRLSAEHRRALLHEYERNARRQLEIERELDGGPPPRQPGYRDRYSDAGRYRR